MDQQQRDELFARAMRVCIEGVSTGGDITRVLDDARAVVASLALTAVQGGALIDPDEKRRADARRRKREQRERDKERDQSVTGGVTARDRGGGLSRESHAEPRDQSVTGGVTARDRGGGLSRESHAEPRDQSVTGGVTARDKPRDRPPSALPQEATAAAKAPDLMLKTSDAAAASSPLSSPNGGHTMSHEKRDAERDQSEPVITSSDLAAEWRPYVDALAPGNSHPSTRPANAQAYVHCANALNAFEAGRLIALRAVVAWFWIAPEGPVKGGRLRAHLATPQHLAERFGADLEAAQAWWFSGGGARAYEEFWAARGRARREEEARPA